MKKEEDINKDEFIKELMKDAKMEKTSNQFTNKVMDRVMQDWLAKPIEMKKPISRKKWILLLSILFVVVLVLLGTDVRTLVSNLEHPFFAQLDVMFLQPINYTLNSVLNSLINIPAIVYIVVVAMASLAAFDHIVNKFAQFR